VLDVYHWPYDSAYPTVCLDETSKQLVGAVRTPQPATPGQPAREDDEYERRGVANLFVVTEPLTGWRQVTVTDQRTAQDFAHVIQDRVDGRYPAAERITLMLDNRNTHSIAALYSTFAPAEAKRLADKLEIHHTPNHGSWLNMAEIAFSVLARQCLDRRIADKETLMPEVAAWEAARNRAGVGAKWRFTTADARIRLHRLYPAIPDCLPPK